MADSAQPNPLGLALPLFHLPRFPSQLQPDCISKHNPVDNLVSTAASASCKCVQKERREREYGQSGSFKRHRVTALRMVANTRQLFFSTVRQGSAASKGTTRLGAVTQRIPPGTLALAPELESRDMSTRESLLSLSSPPFSCPVLGSAKYYKSSL